MRPVTLNNVLTLSLAAAQLAASAAVKGPAIQARGESPSFPFDPETTADCTLWYDTVGASTCLKLLEVNAIPIADFVKWVFCLYLIAYIYLTNILEPLDHTRMRKLQNGREILLH